MNIGIIGSTGRLANEIIELLRNQDSHKLTAAITRKGNQNIGQKIKCNSEVVEITSDFSQCETCDVLIDVTRRDAFINQNLEIYKKLKKPLILATTGFTEEDEKKIHDLSNVIPLCKSANFSEELFYFIKAVKTYSKITDIKNITIIEYHHVNKKDIPSGTALLIRDEILSVSKDASISIHSIRTGNIKGEHVVLFANTYGEEIVFKHKATDRSVFAGGILKVAEILVNKKQGFFSFSEIIEKSH